MRYVGEEREGERERDRERERGHTSNPIHLTINTPIFKLFTPFIF